MTNAEETFKRKKTHYLSLKKHPSFKIADLLNNLIKQVDKRVRLLPYEIFKCIDNPFQVKENRTYQNVEFEIGRLERVNRKE